MPLNFFMTGIYFLIFSLFGSAGFAQEVSTIDLAKQLCDKIGVVREVRKNIEEGHKRQINRGSKSATEKHKMNAIRQRFTTNFEKEKLNIEAAAVNKVAERFSKLFSQNELKYLIDSLKFPVMKKMYDYLLQSNYIEDIELSSLEIAKLYKISSDQILNSGK